MKNNVKAKLENCQRIIFNLQEAIDNCMSETANNTGRPRAKKPRNWKKFLSEYKNGNYGLNLLAKKSHVSVGTVHRWIKESAAV